MTFIEFIDVLLQGMKRNEPVPRSVCLGGLCYKDNFRTYSKRYVLKKYSRAAGERTQAKNAEDMMR